MSRNNKDHRNQAPQQRGQASAAEKGGDQTNLQRVVDDKPIGTVEEGDVPQDLQQEQTGSSAEENQEETGGDNEVIDQTDGDQGQSDTDAPSGQDLPQDPPAESVTQASAPIQEPKKEEVVIQTSGNTGVNKPADDSAFRITNAPAEATSEIDPAELEAARATLPDLRLDAYSQALQVRLIRILQGSDDMARLGLSQVLSYAIKMGRHAPVTPAKGARMQMEFYTELLHVLNQGCVDFPYFYNTVLAVINENGDVGQAFHGVNPQRFWPEVRAQVDATTVENMQFFMHLLVYTSDPKTRKSSVLLRHLNLEDATRMLAPDARQRLMNFYHI